MFRRVFATVAVLSLSLAACGSEHAAVAAYFEGAQSIGERMVQTSGEFEALMNQQENPLEWSAESKAQLKTTLESMGELRADADGMSVPESFKGVHPLLVQSLDEMTGAIGIIDQIADDPSLATMEKANEMTAKAESGEKLANEYVTKLEQILAEKYPELLEE